MLGRALIPGLKNLAERHRVTLHAPESLPLFPETAGPQVLEGYASASYRRAETLFRKGALTWPARLSEVPLVARHEKNRVACRILALEYQADGRLYIKALVKDPAGRRMAGFSIAASIAESTLHAEDSTCFWASVEKATLDEISLNPGPGLSAGDRHQTPRPPKRGTSTPRMMTRSRLSVA
jgi:hypothetical protein